MADLTSLDGSFEKTLTGSNAIKDLPSIVQKYMMAGVSNNKLTFTKLFDEKAVIDNGGLVNVVAQLAMLDEKQQSAFLSLSKLDEKVKDTIKDLLQATKQGELFNSKLFEQEASKEDNISKGVLNEVMQAAGMKDTDGNYLLTNTKDVCDLLEQYANDANNAQKAQELFNAGLLEQSDNGYKVSASLLKLIGAKKSDIVITGIATAGQMAWNYAMQIGKQLLLSLGVAAVAFITTKLVDYIMNLKTRSEELVDAMNNSHDAAQQATKDVEEIQSKIDELNKSLKDAGVDKIEDIVDPTERERLQAINDMLQAQLELKKQLEKDANDKANADTSAVVNDKTEDSIVKTRTVNVSYAEGGANALRIKRRKKGAAIWTSLYQEEIDLNHVIMKMGWSNLHINKTTGQPMGNYKAVTSDYIDKNRVLSFQFKSEDKAFCLIAYTDDRKFIKASSDFTSTDEFRSSSEYKEWFSETFLNNMKYYRVEVSATKNQDLEPKDFNDFYMYSTDDGYVMIDYTDLYAIGRKTDYEYAVAPVANGIELGYAKASVVSDFDGAVITDGNKTYHIFLEPKVDSVEKVRSATVVETMGSKYPYLFAGSEANYYSGHFSGVGIRFDNTMKDFDINGGNAFRDELSEWLTNGSAKLLKMFDGRRWLMGVNGNVSISCSDHYDKGVLEFDFVELGDAESESDMYNNIFDGKLVNGRYRVTNLESRIGKYPISVNVSGYVEPSDIELI